MHKEGEQTWIANEVALHAKVSQHTRVVPRYLGVYEVREGGSAD